VVKEVYTNLMFAVVFFYFLHLCVLFKKLEVFHKLIANPVLTCNKTKMIETLQLVETNTNNPSLRDIKPMQ
jgi:hypothetical protein